MISTDSQHQLVYLIILLKQIRFITTEQDLYLATRSMLSFLEPIKYMPLSRESVPKFGTFAILLNFLWSEDDYGEVSRLTKLFKT